MYNYQCPVGFSEGYLDRNKPCFRDVKNPLSISTNKYVYVKQNFLNPGHMEPKPVVPKVLVNPHFNKKIFVNPNFNVEPPPASCAPKIHLNPNVQKINLNVGDKDSSSVKKIHINPTVLKNASVATTITESNTNVPLASRNVSHISGNMNVIPSTGNKVSSRVGVLNVDTIRKRRSSFRSKFKIIKSSFVRNPMEESSQENRRLSVKSKYKIIKSNCSTNPRCFANTINKFKVDNRRSQTTTLQKSKKYVYVNRLLSISEIARNNLLKNKSKSKKSSLINVGGVLYKRSPNCLRRASIINKIDVSKRPETKVSKSKFKFVKKSSSKANLMVMVKGQLKMSKSSKVKKSVSPGKLRVCNIPCPYYRKYGRCKGKDSGKCYRKHDPDQIALCTKFLQGACIDKKCLLSHNVSPEKMPTCKFYLEGSCSRDDCPYLHVRISPKADICKDFLVGFCKKASECDKRHQFLCPDYEKNGSCLKQRCQYPHGKMVRKYSVFSKNRFAKKSSENGAKVSKKAEAPIGSEVTTKNLEAKSSEASVKNRYYVECNFDVEADCCKAADGDKQNSLDSTSHDQENGARSRPKLGKLPSFIALEGI